MKSSPVYRVFVARLEVVDFSCHFLMCDQQQTDGAALSRNTCEWRESIEDGLSQKLQACWRLTFSVRNYSTGVRRLLCVCCVQNYCGRLIARRDPGG